MKFTDIPQFIRSGNYEVDIPLKSIKRTLRKMDEDYGLELNPDFQRGHVWTEEQQVSYVEFLLKGGVTARVIYFNSPIFANNEDEGDLDNTVICVDGLQRLTACLRFLNNEIKVFGHCYNEYEDEPRIMQGLKFNINGLLNRSDILEWYIQFNDGGTVHTKEEIDRVRKLLEQEKIKQ